MNFKLLFFSFMFVFSSYAQEVMYEDDKNIAAPKIFELKDVQYKAWKKIEEEWQKEYHKILKEQKLKLNCDGCSSVFLDAVISVDATGKMIYYKLINSHKCAEIFSKGLEIRFMKWFFNYKFPPELYNQKFEVRLGNSLKC
jgi:hypothetical protein